MKVLERVLESLIRSQVDINDMQFGFIPGSSTAAAIYFLQQMQEKHFATSTSLLLTSKRPLTGYHVPSFGGL